MNMQADRSLISLIIGPIIGVLVMKGIVAPEQQTVLEQQLELFIGAGIFIGSLIIGSIHHTKLQGIKKNQTTTTDLHLTSTATQPEVKPLLP